MDQALNKIAEELRRPLPAQGYRTVYVVVFAVALVVVMFLSQLAWWWWGPHDILTINSFKVYATPERGQLVLEIDYCKQQRFRDYKSDTQYSLSDGVVYNLPGKSTGPLTPGCHVSTELIFIPALPAGTYRLEMDREYILNPLRTVHVRATSNTFQLPDRNAQTVAVIMELLKDNRQLIQQNAILTRQNESLLGALTKVLKK